MDILKRIPLPLDYFLGMMMILAGAYMFKTYVKIYEMYGLDFDLFIDGMEYMVLVIGGLIMILLPGKNMRRTIWLSGLIMGLSMVSSGMSLISIYYLIQDTGYTKYTLFHFSFGIMSIGCGMAMVINSLFFAFRVIKSVYVIIISLVLAITIEYFTMEFNYEPTLSAYEYLKEFAKIYLPKYLLLILFAILFTSDEVSWYTRKGGMTRALNRLRTTGPVFAVRTISRDQLILLTQCDADYTMVLTQGKYRCYLDVLHRDGVKTLVFRRFGEDSMAGALYLDIQSIVPIGSLAECKYVEMYGIDGRYIRMAVTEAVAKRPRLVVLQKLVFRVPNMYFFLPNKSLYDLVSGTGKYLLKRHKSRSNPYSLEIVSTENGRVAYIYKDGELITTMDLVAVVPYQIYGTYTRLYLYGKMGRFITLRIR